VNAGITALRENIERGQDVAQYVIECAVDGPWTRVAGGTTIGYCKLDRFTSTPLRRVRVTLEYLGTPREITVGLFAGA
jgi:alpha-L-fucosidase